MVMTRKHFKAIADILRWEEASSKMVTRFANFCSKENPNFSYDKFIEACKRD